jgi:hypothetical protein
MASGSSGEWGVGELGSGERSSRPSGAMASGPMASGPMASGERRVACGAERRVAARSIGEVVPRGTPADGSRTQSKEALDVQRREYPACERPRASRGSRVKGRRDGSPGVARRFAGSPLWPPSRRAGSLLGPAWAGCAAHAWRGVVMRPRRDSMSDRSRRVARRLVMSNVGTGLDAAARCARVARGFVAAGVARDLRVAERAVGLRDQRRGPGGSAHGAGARRDLRWLPRRAWEVAA